MSLTLECEPERLYLCVIVSVEDDGAAHPVARHIELVRAVEDDSVRPGDDDVAVGEGARDGPGAHMDSKAHSELKGLGSERERERR